MKIKREDGLLSIEKLKTEENDKDQGFNFVIVRSFAGTILFNSIILPKISRINSYSNQN
jgi:hypothetical protein